MKAWTEESKHHLELMQRYKTAAERSFYRAWNAVQGLRKDRMRMFEKEEKVAEKLREVKREIELLRNSRGPAAGMWAAAASDRAGESSRDRARGADGHIECAGADARGWCDWEVCAGNRAVMEGGAASRDRAASEALARVNFALRKRRNCKGSR